MSSPRDLLFDVNNYARPTKTESILWHDQLTLS